VGRTDQAFQALNLALLLLQLVLLLLDSVPLPVELFLLRGDLRLLFLHGFDEPGARLVVLHAFNLALCVACGGLKNVAFKCALPCYLED
jgi:hypothetical protein